MGETFDGSKARRGREAGRWGGGGGRGGGARDSGGQKQVCKGKAAGGSAVRTAWGGGPSVPAPESFRCRAASIGVPLIPPPCHPSAPPAPLGLCRRGLTWNSARPPPLGSGGCGSSTTVWHRHTASQNASCASPSTRSCCGCSERGLGGPPARPCKSPSAPPSPSPTPSAGAGAAGAGTGVAPMLVLPPWRSSVDHLPAACSWPAACFQGSGRGGGGGGVQQAGGGGGSGKGRRPHEL